MLNARKRRTDDLHKIWEYKNGLNCTPWTDSGKRHTYIYTREHFVKNVSCGYEIVIIFPLLSRYGGGSISSYDRTASTTEASGKKWIDGLREKSRREAAPQEVPRGIDRQHEHKTRIARAGGEKAMKSKKRMAATVAKWIFSFLYGAGLLIAAVMLPLLLW